MSALPRHEPVRGGQAPAQRSAARGLFVAVNGLQRQTATVPRLWRTPARQPAAGALCGEYTQDVVEELGLVVPPGTVCHGQQLMQVVAYAPRLWRGAMQAFTACSRPWLMRVDVSLRGKKIPGGHEQRGDGRANHKPAQAKEGHTAQR